MAAPQIGRYRLAQRQNAVGRRVAVMAVGERLFRSFDDMRGVAKSGWPMPRLMIERPLASSALARASTSKALSVPSRAMRPAMVSEAMPPL
jgi:hypothetical protein